MDEDFEHFNDIYCERAITMAKLSATIDVTVNEQSKALLVRAMEALLVNIPKPSAAGQIVRIK